MIYIQLFWSFFQIGLFSIGGGYAALPLIEQQVVTNNAWLTPSAFTDIVTISQMTPGPIAINSATFVGVRIAGIPGALVATFGSILPSLIIVSILCYLYRRFKKGAALQEVLACLRPAVVALIGSAGVSILLTALALQSDIVISQIDWINAIMFLGAFIVLRKFKCNPILVMSACGILGLILNLIIL